jgi:hypothetical protein
VGFVSILKISILKYQTENFDARATINDGASSLAMAGLSVFDWSSTSHHPSDRENRRLDFVNLPTGFFLASHYLDIR